MNRTEFFQMAKKHAHKPPHEARQDIRGELIAYFKSPAGQDAVRRAPRVSVEFEPNFPLQEQPVERIVDMLMRELDDDELIRLQDKNPKNPA